MTVRISDALEWNAKYTPNKIAIITGNDTFTYSALWSRSSRLCNSFEKMGLVPGDRIALLMGNSHRYLELYQAAAIYGLAVVPLNFRLVDHEIEYVVKHAEAKIFVFDDEFTSIVKSVKGRLDKIVDHYIVSDAISNDAAYGYEELILECEETLNIQKADLNANYYQGYTSGTTGSPKGCENPHGPFVDQLKRIADLYDINSRDLMLSAAPLFHEAPALFSLTQLFRGGTVVITKNTTPENLFSLIARHHITWTMLVPTMWAALVASDSLKSADVSSMRLLVSGGSPLHSSTKISLIDSFSNAGLHEFYGGTEVGLISNLGPEDQLRKERSVGKPVFGMHVNLLDESGASVPQGEIGEIYVGGATLLRQYSKNPEATAAARRGEWLTLGDLGRFDEEGYLYIVDRKKDMIISGGENIFPNDIEDILNAHPAVNMCAVVGAPDSQWGEVVVAAVVRNPGEQVIEEDLIALCKSKLASFKVPRRIDFKEELPLSSFGKILRREVRKWNWEGEAVQV